MIGIRDANRFLESFRAEFHIKILHVSALTFTFYVKNLTSEGMWEAFVTHLKLCKGQCF